MTDQVTDGPWDVSLTLKSGLLEVTHEARIAFPKGPGMAAAVLSHPDQQSPLNWRIISASMALVLMLFATLAIIRPIGAAQEAMNPEPRGARPRRQPACHWFNGLGTGGS